MDKKTDIYDVSNYTDAELLHLLDVPANITDRELEAKILQNIYKYNNIGNESGLKLVSFFTDIYSRLFEVSDNEDEDSANQEGFSLMQNASGGWDKVGDMGTAFDGNYTYLDTLKNDKFGENDPSTIVSKITNPNKNNPTPSDNVMKIDNTNPNRGTFEIGKAPKKDDIAITKQVDYHKDNLNPILKQTIKRIISIDSQYRQDKNASSTSFTFNLSEPLRDVVSLKLYSVQIPYTWYTINSNFGSNFFYIKGNTAGIMDREYKIEIEAGNYTTTELINKISNSLTNDVIKANTDVDFGNTKIEYLPNQVKTKFTFDIRDIYNQNMYSIYFPSEISDFLGFKKVRTTDDNGILYSPCAAIKSTYIIDNATYTCNTDEIITFYSYTGYSYSIHNEVEHFNISIPAFTNKTASELASHIFNQMNNVIDNSSNKLDINNSSCQLLSTTVEGIIKQYIQIVPIFNKSTAKYQEGMRYAIGMPNIAPYNDLFPAEINECNILYGDQPIANPEYKLLGNYTYSIVFECTNAIYINIQENSYTINFSTGGVYTSLQSLINKLNNDIGSSSANINKSRFYLDNNYLKFNAIVEKRFNNSNYEIKSNYEYFSYIPSSPDTEFINMNPTSGEDYIEYTFTITKGENYRIDANTFIEIKPKSGGDNIGESSILIDLNTGINTPQTADRLFAHIYGKIQGTVYLNKTTIAGDAIETPTEYKRKIRIRINRALLTKDYKLHFYTNGEDSYPNFWETKLKFDSSSVLLNNYNENLNQSIVSSQLINPSVLNLIDGQNNTIYIRANNINGLTGSDAEYIPIILSASSQVENGTNYTQSKLIAEINRKFTDNKFLYNSSVNFTKTINQNEEVGDTDLYLNSSPIYVNFDIMFTKMYTTDDYKLVFFDPTNFIKCYIGYDSAKNATWDSTLGWLLGFRDNIEYPFSGSYNNSNITTLIGDTCISLNIYNYFLIMLDDYTQSHINDGLVTISMTDMGIDAPSNTSYVCDPITGQRNALNDGITSRQADANTKKLMSKIVQKSYSSGPFVRDIFGLIPIKTSGMTAGQVYVEFGGSLQNQERTYFGPVNIHRMTIKLLTDRGDLVDLNKANWSFSFICETLYKQ